MNSSSSNERTWRDDAIDESLRGFNNEQALDGALLQVHQCQPALSVFAFWPERAQTLEFLRSQCQDVRPLLAAPTLFADKEQNLQYAAWWELRWNECALELAFLPGYDQGAALCLGANSEEVTAFARAISEHALRPASGRSLRYTAGWESAPELDDEIGKVSWDDIVLPPELLSSVRESVETFFAHKEVVQAFGFAWKRGVLLVGPPGTGKTMVCKAAAAALPELPFLYVRDLRERNLKESIEAIFTRARKLAPCILAMEDLDSLITDSNRSVFLNEMDGFKSNDGILLIASSNHPGKIDEALLKRPSRFDRVFHLGLPKAPERRAFCEKILTRESLAEKLAPGFDVAALSERVAAKTDGFTPAYLKEAFFSAALSRAQNGALVLDDLFVDAVLAQVAELKTHLKKAKNPDAMAQMKSDDDMIGLRR